MMKKSMSSFIFVIFQFFIFISVESKEFNYFFTKGHEEWNGDFGDYNVGEEAFFELAWGWSNIPKQLPIDEQPKGIFLSGNNHSDDLFMFIKRKIKGLRPNTKYDLFFLVTIEDNIYPGQIGVGGSPGESVYFKVGASKKEPKKVADGSIYRLNVDIGEQSQSGKNTLVVGDLANPLVDPMDPQYEPKTFTNTIPLKAKTDSHGHLWIFVGTDSAFEGPTLYYISQVSLIAKRID